MNISKKSLVFLIVFVLFITPVIGCSASQNSVKDNILISDYAVVELGNIWLFDEENSVVGVSYTLRPGVNTEFGKYYDITISWGDYVVSSYITQFRSEDSEFGGESITLENTAAKQFVELLTETIDYQKLLKDFENLQEEKREFHEKEEEIAYNIFWKGEAPSYDEYKKAMAQIQDMDAREKQIIQDFYEFPYTASLPNSFVNSLELVVKAN